MTTQQPIHHFHNVILQRQSVINSTIQQPMIDSLSVLLLSKPLRTLENETLLLEFFGVFWLWGPGVGFAGFFAIEAEAVQHAKSLCV